MKIFALKKGLLLSTSVPLLAIIVPVRSASPAFAQASVTGAGGTITVNTSGSKSRQIPGGIVTSTTTTTTYFNGWPVQRTVPSYYVYIPMVISGTPTYSNEPCMEMTASSKTTSYMEAYQLNIYAIDTWNSLYQLYPACTGTSRQSSPPQQTPNQVVTAFWNSTVRNELPVPRLSVPPGFALTGLEAYLTSPSCATSKTFTDSTPLGTAAIHANGEIWVRWNTGQDWSGPYRSCGLSWPSGTITHVYEQEGYATLSEKETWTANWTLGGESGTLQGLQTSPPPLNLPIRSVTSEIYR